MLQIKVGCDLIIMLDVKYYYIFPGYKVDGSV